MEDMICWNEGNILEDGSSSHVCRRRKESRQEAIVTDGSSTQSMTSRNAQPLFIFVDGTRGKDANFLLIWIFWLTFPSILLIFAMGLFGQTPKQTPKEQVSLRCEKELFAGSKSKPGLKRLSLSTM